MWKCASLRLYVEVTSKVNYLLSVFNENKFWYFILLLRYIFFLKVHLSSYLAVSVVIFICWWICIRKVDRAMFSEEWLVQFRKSQPALKVAKLKNMNKVLSSIGSESNKR